MTHPIVEKASLACCRADGSPNDRSENYENLAKAALTQVKKEIEDAKV